ncbi:hypothetical protein DEI83_11155 [Curtobacterium sp. MCBD17_021]|nr:hypothetical protein DEI83_11155 [Curtobacterium sp. MCBD17_021]
MPGSCRRRGGSTWQPPRGRRRAAGGRAARGRVRRSRRAGGRRCRSCSGRVCRHRPGSSAVDDGRRHPCRPAVPRRPLPCPSGPSHVIRTPGSTPRAVTGSVPRSIDVSAGQRPRTRCAALGNRP